MTQTDPFGVKKEITLDSGKKISYMSLPELEAKGVGPISKLPYSIRIILESVLRNHDNFAFTEEHVKNLANWKPTNAAREETPYMPARVVLQDFTGVPAVVDLAVMRDSLKRLGGDPDKINPQIPCDLVIDHSVQVDFFGSKDALALNEEKEFERNKERYEFLKWGQDAFKKFRVVPPATGIVHQVNLEHLSTVVFYDEEKNIAYPDSCVGTDSHTPMVNGLGVVAWGVGGIEAEAVMLAQPIYMLVPDVIGFKLTGKLPEGATATDMVLKVTEMCREKGVVGKFVEFYGDGIQHLSVSDRATIGNMAPEQGSTVSIFAPDDEALRYMRLTARDEETIELTEKYMKAQGLYYDPNTPDPEFTDTLELDLSTVEPALAGPKRPQDRILLRDLGPTYYDTLAAPVGPKGLGIDKADLKKTATVEHADGTKEEIGQGAVVIAAITSCTNTSNPSVMLAAGLVAKKAAALGIKPKGYVKTSLAPGSTVVTEYLKESGLLSSLEEIGFHVVGYGCTTCIGNSGPLPEAVSKVIEEEDLVVSAVLSGNRNFEGRVNPHTRTNYLASPPLVVAYALAGSTAIDISKDPVAIGSDGNPVYLKDIWPTNQEIETALQSVKSDLFKERYADVWKGSKKWQAVDTSQSALYDWKDESTYIRRPTFFDDVSTEKETIGSISGAQVLGYFADSVTTDHISPAGSIAAGSPAATYLKENGVDRKDWNSYGSRRGNHEVMMRGTFANIRIKNKLVPGSEGNITLHHPTGEQLSFFDASAKYQEEGIPLIVIAGKEYGTGSSRDWAAKGPYLQGLKVVIAESYERIHRSNLIGMGILPLQFKSGESAGTHKLDGTESFDVKIDDTLKPQSDVEVTVTRKSGESFALTALNRIDTPVEIEYYRNGGILHTVLKKMI